MNPRQFWRILKARAGTAWTVFLLIVAAAVAAVFLLPKQYTAIATLLDDPSQPDPLYGQVAQNPDLVPGHLATNIDIISSDRVAKKVVAMLHLDQDPKLVADYNEAGPERGTFEQYYAQKLVKALDVKTVGESNVIVLQFTAKDPKLAADGANAFATAFIDTVGNLRIDTAKISSKFFDERAKKLRDKLISAQGALADYQRAHGLVPGDTKSDIENARLAELSSQLTAVQALRADSASRRREAESQFGASADVLANPVVLQLRAQVAAARVKLDELAKRLGHNHPEYIAAEADLDSLQGRLAAEQRHVASAISSSDAVNQQREAEIKASLDAQKKRVMDLQTFRDQASVLQRDVDDAQRAYDTVSQRFAQTDLERQNHQTLASILTEAEPPSKPSKPKKTLTVAVASVIGLLLGIGAALAREVLDGRLRDADDLGDVYRLPVLVALPSAKTIRAFRGLARPEPTLGRLSLPEPDGG